MKTKNETKFIENLKKWIDERLEHRFVKGMEKQYEKRYNKGWYDCLEMIKKMLNDKKLLKVKK